MDGMTYSECESHCLSDGGCSHFLLFSDGLNDKCITTSQCDLPFSTSWISPDALQRVFTVGYKPPRNLYGYNAAAGSSGGKCHCPNGEVYDVGNTDGVVAV